MGPMIPILIESAPKAGNTVVKAKQIANKTVNKNVPLFIALFLL
jgi:hypothetical protein